MPPNKHHKPSLLVMVTAIMLALFLGWVLLIGLGEITNWFQWWPHISLQEIEQTILSSGHWGIIVAMGLMVLHSFIPFPAELVAIANGMIYGPLLGTVITWSGAMLGAVLSFGLARKWGRPLVSRILSRNKLQAMDHWIGSHGPGALMFSRFIPVIAFNLINYAAGLTRIRWWTFIWITAIGILPLTTLMVILGHNIESLPFLIWLLLLFTGLLLWLLTHRFMQRRIAQQETNGKDTD